MQLNINGANRYKKSVYQTNSPTIQKIGDIVDGRNPAPSAIYETR